MDDSTPTTADGSGAMFDRIAGRYDLLNRIISLGQDQSWRRQLVATLDVRADQRVLDVATGTGDLLVQLHQAQPRAQLTGVDTSEKMLQLAAEKVTKVHASAQIDLTHADVHQLPFTDNTFDLASVAFGVRNFKDRPRAFAELARVLRPGGRLAVLELSFPRRGVTSPAARLYISHVVPSIGALLSGREAYRYLADSIAKFPPPEEICGLMENAGLALKTVRPLSFGAAVLYLAERRSPIAR